MIVYLRRFLTSIILFVTPCIIPSPASEEGLAIRVKGHGKLLHLLSINFDLELLVITPDCPKLSKSERKTRYHPSLEKLKGSLSNFKT